VLARSRHPLAVQLGNVSHANTIAFGGRTLGIVPFAALLAQGFDHIVDISVNNLDFRTLDLHVVDLPAREFRETLPGGGELEATLIRPGEGSRRVTPATRISCSDGLFQAALHHLAEHFLADLFAIALTNHVDRHLARAESLEPHLAAQFIQTPGHLGVNVFGRNLDGHAPLQIACFSMDTCMIALSIL
jgi:hypothetical protein